MNQKKTSKFSLYLVYGLMILGTGIVPLALSIASKEDITIAVEDKERIVNRDASKYLIFTEEEVFENTDEWLYFKFNSSDIYGQLKEGRTYNVTVVGRRIPFFSSYRNILDINAEEE